MKPNNLKLKYSCPAQCPQDIFMNKTYLLNKDNKGFYFGTDSFVQYADIEYIKMLFTPIDYTWDKVLAEEVENIEEEPMVKEEIKTSVKIKK